MKTITLDMTITAEQAHAAWEALDDETPGHIRDAYFRRYARRKEGMTNPVTCTVGESATASIQERTVKVSPTVAAKLAARKAAVQPPAPKSPKTKGGPPCSNPAKAGAAFNPPPPAKEPHAPTPLIHRPLGGVLFERLAFNADQTFSVIGDAAFTSRILRQ